MMSKIDRATKKSNTMTNKNSKIFKKWQKTPLNKYKVS